MYCKKIFHIIALVSVTISSAAYPQRTFNYFESSRALSMGNAYTAYGEGFDAVYYNPAGLARNNPPQAKYFDVELGGSGAFGDVFSTLFTSLGSVPAAMQVMTENPGVPYGVHFSFLPQFIVKNFSLGIIGRSYAEGIVDADTLDMDFFAFNDVGLYAHFAVAFWGGVVKVGAGAKAINRAEINQTFSQAEYTSASFNLTNQWTEGVGYGFDAGILLTAPVQYLPTLGIAVTDITNTEFLERRMLFTDDVGAGAPAAIAQKVNVGFALNPKHGRGFKSTIAVDVRDVLSVNSNNYLDHTHLGWELQASELLKIRAGYHQGAYWTAGLGFYVAGVILEFATYGENVAHATGGRRDDRKWIGRYALQF